MDTMVLHIVSKGSEMATQKGVTKRPAKDEVRHQCRVGQQKQWQASECFRSCEMFNGPQGVNLDLLIQSMPFALQSSDLCLCSR